jgi:hypothetical protein
LSLEKEIPMKTSHISSPVLSTGSTETPAVIVSAGTFDDGNGPQDLYVPHRSRHVAADDWTIFEKPIPAHWHALAAAKGYDLVARVRDRRHVILKCRKCGALTVQKMHVLRTAQPACGGCQHAAHVQAAIDAGLAYLGRDPAHHKQGVYRATCGHVLIRQFGFVERMAKGEVQARCEICLNARDAATAEAHDWTLIGADPQGRANYRLYAHSCGHEQRVARANMQWGQLDCAACGTSWAAMPSYIYLIRISWIGQARSVLKLGFSKHPDKRFKHQLGLPEDTEVEVLQLIPMPTGAAAQSAEKRIHAALRKSHPQAVIPTAQMGHLINVTSELYATDIAVEIAGHLDALRTAQGQPA